MKITFLTDIHIGNPKVYLDRITESLHKYAYPELTTSQLILLGGDFFDCLLNINSDAGIRAIYIIDELIELCRSKNIYLRVLRGTFSHDRYQNRLFVDRARAIPTYHDIPLIRVIDTVEVERFAPYNCDILFCPDDQPQKDMSQVILDVLEANHLDQVDFFCCHGYWNHLLPPNLLIHPNDCLDYDRLESKIRCYVFNGHVHSPSLWNKVVSGGSFERFRHGEEEDKGFYTAEFNEKEHTATLKFIRNVEAVPFITVDLSLHTSVDEALDYLKRKINTMSHRPDQVIHIRLIGNGDPLVPTIQSTYPRSVITIKKLASPVEEVVLNQSDMIHDLPTITEENLPILIYDNVHETCPSLTVDRVKEILNGQ